MLDSARHFQSMDEIRKLLDAMAQHKLNTFHWHLTDYHGWRVETRRNPGLNDPKSRDRKPNGQYSVAEVKDLVAFAAARGIDPGASYVPTAVDRLHRGAHRGAKTGVDQRGRMLQFASGADDGALAIVFD